MKKSFLLLFVFISFCILAAGPSSAIDGKNGKKKPECFREQYDPAVRQAALIPGGVFGFFEPGQEITLRLLIESPAADLDYALTVKDESGREICRIPRKKREDLIRLPGQEAGYYVVEAEIFADGAKSYRVQGGFAVAPVPGKRDPFFQFGFGVLRELHDGYKRVGCGSIAMKLDWRFALPHRDVKRTADQMLNQSYKPFLESGDFQLVADLGTSLPRADIRSPEEMKRGMPLMNDSVIKVYSDFIAEVAPRIKTKEWVIGQETPSNATNKSRYIGTWSEAMANFVTLVRLGSRQLKQIDPEIRIIAGGNNVPPRTQDIEPIQMGDIVDDFDIYYIDAYTGNWDLAKGSVTLPEAALMKFYREASALSVQLGKGKFIANNETGYSINFGAPFDTGLAPEQARLTARSLIISKAAPVLFYQLFRPNDYNRIPESNDSMHMATIWKTIPFGGAYHRVPLPGGAMYATAAAELAFAEAEAEIINGGIYSYIFRKPDGSTLVTIWTIGKQQSFPLPLPLPAGSRVLNMYGRNITGHPLVIGPDPLYITVDRPAADVVPVIDRAIYANTPEFKCVALPDSVLIRSLLRTPRKVEIRMPGQDLLTAEIQPDETCAFPMTVTAPGKLISGEREYDIPLEDIPVCTLKRVSGPEQLRTGAPGLLHYPDHIRPIEALQPERCFFYSKNFNPNGHNVSAKYWTGYDNKNFYLAVEVDDPVHLQRYTGRAVWRDDSIQFVLSPRDHRPSCLLNDTEPKEVSEFNFGLALTPKGVQVVKLGGKDPGIKDFPASVVREGNTTRYEVAVPWSAVGGKAKRFGFLVWDNNDPVHSSAPYRLEFTPGIAGGADSSKLARVEYE
ncbi:MAG: hypothetical protein J5944_06755 [Lentisphaeria bacterium]|nr:hypothetical protein [Lentisphaeria bacterium]